MKPFTVIGLMIAASLLTAAIMTSRPNPAKDSAARAPLPSPDAQPRVRTFHPPPRSADAEAEPAPTTRRAFAARSARRTAGLPPAAQPPTTPLPVGPPRTGD